MCIVSMEENFANRRPSYGPQSVGRDDICNILNIDMKSSQHSHNGMAFR